MNQTEKAKRFAKLHVKGSPLLLYNAWDAGSAKAVAEAGAKAIASKYPPAEPGALEDGPLEAAVETLAPSHERSLTSQGGGSVSSFVGRRSSFVR